MESNRQHRLMLPVMALFAIVLNFVIFRALNIRMGADAASDAAATLAFIVILILGLMFRPHLGD